MITSGLDGVMISSAPTVFDMGNVTDSYNISINNNWHNTTKETFVYNIPPDSSGWTNITVWAWNASGTGTLSTGFVSDKVPAAAELSDAFVLVSSAPGTYPPGWLETPAPTPTVTSTATEMPAASAANTSVDVMQSPPNKSTTPPPGATDQTPITAPATGATPTQPEQDLPGFTAAFVCCGWLAAAYAAMRRRS
ncbi:MAG: hypothetical protein EF813_03925 [Methanosarcinales archaeon]|nr:MAG: hypothetical protein EF813_03925 [Methanosarcinales archaeon]